MKKDKTNSKKKTLIELSVCIFILLVLFIPTLNRPWLLYDENILFNGNYFPIPISLSEMFEIIKTFGLNFNIISSNTMYSSNHVTRTTPLGQLLGMTISFFFKKDPFYFHLFNFFLHTINTCLVFFILKHFLKSNGFYLMLLTSIWAIHPVMIEPILLSTNFGATYSYMFFFSFLIDFLKNKDKNTSNKRLILIPVLFLIPMLTNEYIVTTPLVLFTISFFYNHENDDFSKAFNKSFKETLPYFIGLLIYAIYFLTNNFKSSHPTLDNEFIVLLERVFWLAPQIFFHLLSLVFYPEVLSIDQTIFVKLGETLFSPYSIFCIVFFFAWLLTPLYFFVFKKKYKILFFISWGFFFSILPFLHILMPSYTLAAERYLYAPFSILIFGIGILLKSFNEKFKSKQYSITSIAILALVLTLCFIRSYNRTLDWKDNYSFINSTYNSTKDPFLKAIKLGMLGKTISVFEPSQTEKIKSYFTQTLGFLQEAKKDIEIKKSIYGDKTPLIVKSYGLDYDSLLTKIAFLEVASRCIELKEDYRIGLNILNPYINNIKKINPSISEMYAYLLILNGNIEESKTILLKSLDTYPNDLLILNKLIDISISYDKDLNKAESYLLKELKYYPYEPEIILKAISFYALKKDVLKVAKYSYLYGLRTQIIEAYIQSLSFYLKAPEGLNEAIKVKNKLLKIAPNNGEVLFILNKYNLK